MMPPPYRHTQINPSSVLSFILIAVIVVPLYGWSAQRKPVT
jgi:hypothetical protein